MRPLAVVGMGMISPLGWTPAEHVFFARAEVGPAAPGAFLDARGKTLQVAYCPWLGASMSVGERMSALGRFALSSALEPVRARDDKAPLVLMMCTALPRPGLLDSDRGVAEAGSAAEAGVQVSVRLSGAAGFFAGIDEAARLLDRKGARAVAIVAVDSLVSIQAVAEWERNRSTAWEHRPPRPSEAAAAILLMTPEDARRDRMDIVAMIHDVATKIDEANDDNDAIVTGAAMTSLLHAMSAPGAIAAAFGQTGGMRGHEWAISTARTASRFTQTCTMTSVEQEIGSLGAAAAAANLVFAIAMKRHDSWPEPLVTEGPLLAWAISADGTRGICTASAETVLEGQA